jgi:RNA polymerase sigma-70 factor, ECF subfamily
MADNLGGEALFDRYFEQVYAYVAYRTAPDGEAARDVTQEVFLAACRSAESLRNDGVAMAWLRAIARAKVADYFRSAARRSETPTPTETLAELPAANPDVHWNAQQARAVQVARILRSLPEGYGNVLEEKYLDGMSVREMAARRGQSEKAVESALTRARTAFRNAWAATQGQELDDEFGSLGEHP